MLVLTRFVKEYEPKRLASEARKMDIEVDLVKYGQISLEVSDKDAKIDLGKGRKLNDYDVIVPRAATKKGSSLVGIKTVVLQELKRNSQARVLNGDSFAKYPLLGKTEQGMILAQAGLPTVPFVTFASKKGWREFRSNPSFNFPIILKGRFGSHGRRVKLVNDWEQFDRVFKEYEAGLVLIQPKIRVKQWYRCVVVNGEYLGEMRHRQKDKYGGEEGKMIKFNSTKMGRLKEICLEAVRLFECDYAGLDVLWDEDEQDWRIIEVNRAAQFEYFEARTEVNVAEKVISSLL